ncbi:MAG: beta-lactamase family protein [Calditrichaeota bacterium]|nr:beta-lactamase family protein [Calditrichota bacterium]
MNKLLKIFLLLSILSLSFCARTPEEKINRWMAMYSGSDSPGAALMVVKNGAPILVKTYGMADVENQVPVTPETNFRLASVTKQFTAMCILMLMEQGKLSETQTLQDIFPDFPDYGKKITIHNLIHHTSGLIDYESLIPDSATEQVLDRDVLEMMKAQDSTYFAPGTKYQYSNTGYAVLAMIIEKISGQRFADFLRENIFLKIGMKNTVAYEKGISTVENRAYGYALENGELVPKDQSLTSAVLGDGGIYSSVPDLYKWDQALYTETLVSSASLKFAFTPDTLLDGTPTIYGFGWRIDKFLGHRRIHHTGQTCGFTTIIQRFPDDRFSIIILTNRNKPMLNEVAEKIARLYLGKNQK